MNRKTVAASVGGVALLLVIVWMVFVQGSGEGPIRITTFCADGLLDDLSDAARLEAIGSALRKGDADILAIEGVASEAVVRSFAQEHLRGMGYAHIVSLGDGDSSGQQNAVLSRFPIGESREFPDASLEGKHPRVVGGKSNPFAGRALRFHRSPMMVRIQAEPDPLVLFVVDHKGGNRYSYWREAEAGSIVRLARQHSRGLATFIVGAFHDEHGSATLLAYADGGFDDPTKTRSEGGGFVTESGGDRADFILCRGKMKGAIDPARASVAELSVPGVDDVHYPLTIEYDPPR